eukprot:TRINITY_DN18412_c0_g2_i2.p1 TRINITY_DN18412_c0_g2~~TRINITY_DN18412_c0_g2_i2.p1  ORF type:complete len:374 (+),score=94.22 TRINITY_DN18412_c0_g2_i2:73-1122(+)
MGEGSEEEEVPRKARKARKSRKIQLKARKIASSKSDANGETKEETAVTISHKRPHEVILSIFVENSVQVSDPDGDGRNGLHYLFVEIDKNLAGNQGDPIEILSDFYAMFPGCDGNARDKYERTPMHYAAMTGSLVSTIYLMQQGAHIDLEDIFKNRPLQYSLMFHRKEYSISLMNMLLNRNDAGSSADVALPQQSLCVIGENDKEASTTQPMSTFRYLLQQKWMGLVYVLLENSHLNMDIGESLSDALATDRFWTGLKILGKVSKKRLAEVDKKTGKSLFHVLAEYKGHSAEFEEFSVVIASFLLSSNVSIVAKDSVHRNLPIHIALQNGHAKLVEILLNNMKKKRKGR